MNKIIVNTNKCVAKEKIIKTDTKADNIVNIDLLKVQYNDIHYGKLVYNIDTDNILYINTSGIQKQLTTTVRRDITIDKIINNNLQYGGQWNKEVDYNKNNLITEMTTGNIYLCKNPIKSKLNPSLDSTNWDLFIEKNNNQFKGVWIKDNKYYKDNIVIYDNKIFQSLVYNDSSISVSDDWKVILDCSIRETTNSNALLYIIMNPKNINCKKIIADKKSIFIDFDSVVHIDKKCYNFYSEDNSIYINKEGIYRITYNISYNGTVGNITSMVTLIDDNLKKFEIIQQSIITTNNINEIIKSINKDESIGSLESDSEDLENKENISGDESEESNNAFNDIYIKKVKKISQESIVEDNTVGNILKNNINHTFVLPIKQKDNIGDINYKIILNLKTNISDDNKILYIYSSQTWITFEKIF